MRSQTGKNSRPLNTALADRLSIQDYLNLKEELRFRIVRLVPEIVQSAYFYGSIATGDISPGLSDPDVYVVLKTEKVHWIHFDTDINVDRTLSNPLALLTYLYRSEFIAGEKLNLPKPDYDKILIWMREFMAPPDEKKQLEKWLLSTRVIQGPKGLFYLLDSTIFISALGWL